MRATQPVEQAKLSVGASRWNDDDGLKRGTGRQGLDEMRSPRLRPWEPFHVFKVVQRDLDETEARGLRVDVICPSIPGSS